MKQLISILTFLMVSVNVLAQENIQKISKKSIPSAYKSTVVDYMEGEVPYMFEEIIKTSLDYAEAKYLPRKVKYDENGNKLKEPKITGNSFHVFLAKSKRDKNWEDASLAYFCESFNKQTNGIVVCSGDCDKTNYEFVIKILEVYRNGNIKVNVLLKDAKTGGTLCVFECLSSDCDDDDEITLRDQLRTIGAYMGSVMNRIQRYNAKQILKK